MSFNTGNIVTSPVIGINIFQISKPLGTVGATSDATAPFALGAMVTGEQGELYQFARCIANVNNGATTAITAGLTAGVATATNTWTNNTGTNAVIGDYLWFAGKPATQ